MREFHQNGKINFVDNNDVYVGFDQEGSCCERFGWFYSEDIPTSAALDAIARAQSQDGTLRQTPANLEDYQFDRDFFQEGPTPLDEGASAIFKLSAGSNVRYLCLYNSHNGYYSHGFDVQVGGKVIRQGSL